MHCRLGVGILSAPFYYKALLSVNSGLGPRRSLPWEKPGSPNCPTKPLISIRYRTQAWRDTPGSASPSSVRREKCRFKSMGYIGRVILAARDVMRAQKDGLSGIDAPFASTTAPLPSPSALASRSKRPRDGQRSEPTRGRSPVSRLWRPFQGPLARTPSF